VKVLGRRYVRKYDSNYKILKTKTKMNSEIECTFEEFDCPWPEYNVRFEEDYEDDEIDPSWSEFDASKYDLFPIEIHYMNMATVFYTTEILHTILEYFEELDENVLMVNRLFYLVGVKIKTNRYEKRCEEIKQFILNSSYSPFIKPRL
jgi:hypothetical protein